MEITGIVMDIYTQWFRGYMLWFRKQSGLEDGGSSTSLSAVAAVFVPIDGASSQLQAALMWPEGFWWLVTICSLTLTIMDNFYPPEENYTL